MRILMRFVALVAIAAVALVGCKQTKGVAAYQAGRSFEERSRPDSALFCYKLALTQNRNLADAHFALGKLLTAADSINQADKSLILAAKAFRTTHWTSRDSSTWQHEAASALVALCDLRIWSVETSPLSEKAVTSILDQVVENLRKALGYEPSNQQALARLSRFTKGRSQYLDSLSFPIRISAMEYIGQSLEALKERFPNARSIRGGKNSFGLGENGPKIRYEICLQDGGCNFGQDLLWSDRIGNAKYLISYGDCLFLYFVKNRCIAVCYQPSLRFTNYGEIKLPSSKLSEILDRPLSEMKISGETIRPCSYTGSTFYYNFTYFSKRYDAVIGTVGCRSWGDNAIAKEGYYVYCVVISLANAKSAKP